MAIYWEYERRYAPPSLGTMKEGCIEGANLIINSIFYLERVHKNKTKIDKKIDTKSYN
jgi:hypothetical protein